MIAGIESILDRLCRNNQDPALRAFARECVTDGMRWINGDLLECCKDLCRRLEVNELVNRPDKPGNEYDQPAYDRAKAAIAAAEAGAA